MRYHEYVALGAANKSSRERLGSSNCSGGASSKLHFVAREFCSMYATFVDVAVCVPINGYEIFICYTILQYLYLCLIPIGMELQ